MQIIVLDGPDAVGKTTIAKEFIRKFPNTKYIHNGYRWKDKIFDYHTAVMKLASKWAMTHNVIIDRWWPSEACYASVYRNTSAWPLQGRFHERLALKYGVIYLLCLPDQNTLDRHTEMKKVRDEMYENIEDLCDLYYKLYYGDLNHKDKGNYIDKLILSGGVKDIPYYIPYTIERWGAHLDTFLDLVMHVATEMRESQFQDALSPFEHNVLGHPKFAKYMFVGDRVNPKYRDIFWPFFEYGNSSLYFTEALNDLWIKERDYMWTNAYDKDGKIDLKYAELANERGINIIALGKNALNALKQKRIEPDEIMPHPSHYKRFNGSKNHAIVEDLKGVLC